jgi:ABC-type Na+ efflux pump permease subunit
VLFLNLHRTLFYDLWIIVPMMTADCISRERREGTLGLLFLTPLTTFDVILGKAAIHAIRAWTLFLAAVPMLALPLFLGGVTWQMVAYGILQEATAALLGIGVGVYASTAGGTAIQVMVRAELGGLTMALFNFLWTSRFIYFLLPRSVAVSWYFALCVLWALTVFSLLLWAGTRRLKKSWNQQSATSEQPRWVRLFSSSEFWRSFFHWDKSRTLDRNPVAWLQEYSWTARLTKWGWLYAVLFAELAMLFNSIIFQRPAAYQAAIICAVSLGAAFSAVKSFRAERESGALEVLLVTPLSERHLVRGRLWGLVCHFFPAVAILIVGTIGARLMNQKSFHTDPLAAVDPNPIAFLAIMVCGLYLSLSRINILLAWLFAWALAFVMPAVLGACLQPLTGMARWGAVTLTTLAQFALCGAVWLLVQRKVRLRTFVPVRH